MTHRNMSGTKDTHTDSETEAEADGEPDDRGQTRITRRQILAAAGAAGAAGGVAAIGGLGSPFEETDAEPPEYDEEYVTTACWAGKQDCAQVARKVDGRAVRFEPHDDEIRTGGTHCTKGEQQIADLYDPYRVKQPLRRTNEKGVHGEWEAVTWDEALGEIGERLAEIAEDDVRRIAFQSGRRKVNVWHYDGFRGAIEETYADEGERVDNWKHGPVCGDGMYRATEIMTGGHAGTQVDYENCEYFINMFGLASAGGSNTCQISWNRQTQYARERNDMEVVHVNPQRFDGGTYTDEWVPVEPGTDLAFFLGVAHVLVHEEDLLDEWWLKKFSNAPALVDSDGKVLRAEDADPPDEEVGWAEGELVYDTERDAVVTHEEALEDGEPALYGEYEYGGETVRPAFEEFVEGIEEYTPEWASEKVGGDVTPEQIRRVARGFGETALNGEKITYEEGPRETVSVEEALDGDTIPELDAHIDASDVEIPYRPAAIGAYHAPQNEQCLETCNAIIQVSMLVGAIDVAGSTRTHRHSRPRLGYREDFHEVAYNADEVIDDEPDGPQAERTVYYPIDSATSNLQAEHMLYHDEYDMPYPPEEMAAVVQMANPVASFPPIDKQIEAWKRMDTVVVVDPFVSETADVAADYILPAATIDKYEGVLGGANNGYGATNKIRTSNVVDGGPLYDSKADGDIFALLLEEAGAGGAFANMINEEYGTEFETAGEITVEEAIRRGTGKTVEEWEDPERGVEVTDFNEEVVYMYLQEEDGRAYGGVKQHFYPEILEQIGDAVEGRLDTEEFPYLQDYNAVPEWRDPTMWESQEQGYEHVLMSKKEMAHKQSRTAQNPLANELSPDARIWIHTSTAEDIGVEDGDKVRVRSHNPVKDIERDVVGLAKVIEGIQPDTVCIPFHQGGFGHPRKEALDEGVAANWLFPSGPGFVDLTQQAAFQVCCDVEAAPDAEVTTGLHETGLYDGERHGTQGDQA